MIPCTIKIHSLFLQDEAMPHPQYNKIIDTLDVKEEDLSFLTFPILLLCMLKGKRKTDVL